MPRFTCEPGRNIYRDGKPFVYLARAEAAEVTTDNYVSPTEADAFARALPAVINSLRDMATYIFPGNDEPLRVMIEDARAALAALEGRTL